MGILIDFAPYLEKKKVALYSPEDFFLYFDTDDEIWIAEANGKVVHTFDSYEEILEISGWNIIMGADDICDDEFFDYEEM